MIQPDAPKRGFSRRTLTFVLVGLLGVLLIAGGATAFVISRTSTPGTPTELIDAYLNAVRDGDIDRAVSFWNDVEGDTDGAPSTRQRVRAYLEKYGDDYKRTLAGKAWTLTEYQAAGSGIGVDVALGTAKETYVVVRSRSDSKHLLIFAGPEDALGFSDTEGNAFIGGA